MRTDLVFLLNIAGVSVAFSFGAWLVVWPRLRAMPRDNALKLLVLPHAFRFIGLGFLIDGVVSPELTSSFVIPAAWGDFGAALLAVAAIVSLQARKSVAAGLVWILSVWGSVDLLYAYYNGIALDIDPGLFGAYYLVPTFVVPLLLVSHTLTILLLVRGTRDDPNPRDVAAKFVAKQSAMITAETDT
jgi:hypothetical protein